VYTHTPQRAQDARKYEPTHTHRHTDTHT